MPCSINSRNSLMFIYDNSKIVHIANDESYREAPYSMTKIFNNIIDYISC